MAIYWKLPQYHWDNAFTYFQHDPTSWRHPNPKKTTVTSFTKVSYRKLDLTYLQIIRSSPAWCPNLAAQNGTQRDYLMQSGCRLILWKQTHRLRTYHFSTSRKHALLSLFYCSTGSIMLLLRNKQLVQFHWVYTMVNNISPQFLALKPLHPMNVSERSNEVVIAAEWPAWPKLCLCGISLVVDRFQLLVNESSGIGGQTQAPNSHNMSCLTAILFVLAPCNDWIYDLWSID